MVLIISIYSLHKITSRITNTRFVLLSRRLALYFLAFRSFPTHPPKTAVLSPNGSAINCPDMAQTWLWSRDYCVWDKLNVTSVKEKLLSLESHIQLGQYQDPDIGLKPHSLVTTDPLHHSVLYLNYRMARNFCGSLFLRIGDFLCFAGTNFCD